MHSRIISYESIYELLNTPEDRKLRATIRSQTERLLDNYVNIRYIDHYEIVRRGRAITGVQIFLIEETTGKADTALSGGEHSDRDTSSPEASASDNSAGDVPLNPLSSAFSVESVDSVTVFDAVLSSDDGNPPS